MADNRVEVSGELHGCWYGLVEGTDRTRSYEATLWLAKDGGRSHYKMVRKPLSGTLLNSYDPYMVVEHCSAGGQNGRVHLYLESDGTLKVEWEASQCRATMKRCEPADKRVNY